MKAKLLRKARKKLVIIQNKKTKKYRLRHGGYQPAGASKYSYKYNTGWITDLEYIRSEKRKQTIVVAREIFNSYVFKYVRSNFKVIN